MFVISEELEVGEEDSFGTLLGWVCSLNYIEDPICY